MCATEIAEQEGNITTSTWKGKERKIRLILSTKRSFDMEHRLRLIKEGHNLASNFSNLIKSQKHLYLVKIFVLSCQLLVTDYSTFKYD